jgi:hypothetical protein
MMGRFELNVLGTECIYSSCLKIHSAQALRLHSKAVVSVEQQQHQQHRFGEKKNNRGRF